MTLLSSARTVLNNQAVAVGAADTQRYREGRFELSADLLPAYTQVGPAHLAASIFRHTREPALLNVAVDTIDRFIADYVNYDGGVREAADPTGSEISGVEFVAIAGKTLLALGRDVAAERTRVWIQAIARIVDWVSYFKAPYYVNGNVELCKLEALWLASSLTGEHRFRVGYERQIKFIEAPDVGKTTGLVTTTAGADSVGTGAVGYIMESGAGGDGLDWHYSHLSSSIAANLWWASRDPRVFRWMGMIIGTLNPRIDRAGATLRYDVASGTRISVGAASPVYQPWTSAALPALVAGGRTTFASDAALSETSTVTEHLARSLDGGSPFIYRSASRDLACRLDMIPAGQAT